VVAVLLRHDAQLIVALLGALKSGATAVVLDPRWPPERMRRIREELDARIVLADSAHHDLPWRLDSRPQPSSRSLSAQWRVRLSRRRFQFRPTTLHS
jgi:non-ribosomal peptide synthetase component F